MMASENASFVFPYGEVVMLVVIKATIYTERLSVIVKNSEKLVK